MIFFCAGRKSTSNLSSQHNAIDAVVNQLVTGNMQQQGSNLPQYISLETVTTSGKFALVFCISIVSG